MKLQMDERFEQFMLRHNPFMVLGASAATSRDELTELADEVHGQDNVTSVEDALRILSNQQHRLDAEIAWLPGVNAADAVRLIGQAESAPLSLSTDRLDALAAANLFSYALSVVLARTDKNRLIRPLVIALIKVGVYFDPAAIAGSINDDREVAGFRSLDVRVIAHRATERIAQFVALTGEAIQRLSMVGREEVLSTCLKEPGGESPFLCLVVDRYHEDLRPEIEALSASLIAKSDRIAPAGSTYRDDIANLTRLTRDFGLLTGSVTTSRVERGLPNHEMHQVFYAVRSVAIDLFNEHALVGDATSLLRALQQSFNSIPELSERASKDLKDLLAIVKSSSAVSTQQPGLYRQPSSPGSDPVPAQNSYESTGGSIPPKAPRRSFPTGWITTGVIFLVIGFFRWASSDADSATPTSYYAPPRTATAVIAPRSQVNTSCSGIIAWWDASTTRWDRANTIFNGVKAYSTTFQVQNAQRLIYNLATEQRLSSPPLAAASYNNDMVYLMNMDAEYLTSNEQGWSYNSRYDAAFSTLQLHERQTATVCSITLTGGT